MSQEAPPVRKNAREYHISIQRFRYGEDYFQFDCMVDDGLGDIEIPVLLLQTLVENSFSHGLTPERKGEISLFITKEKHNDAECLYICVSDNGKGFSAEVLEKLKIMAKSITITDAMLAFKTSKNV